MPQRLRRLFQSALALACVGALAAPAVAQTTTQKPPDPVTGAVEQPFKDLNIVRDKIPAVLSRAAVAPYVETQPARLRPPWSPNWRSWTRSRP